MQGNTLQSTGYQPMRRYICLPTTQYKVAQPRVGQYHFTVIKGWWHKSYIYTHESLKTVHIHNTNHVLTYIQKLRCCSHCWTPHTFWQESSNSYVPHMGFHSHQNSTVLHQITRDTQKLYGHESTMHPKKKKLVIHENKEALLSNWITCATEFSSSSLKPSACLFPSMTCFFTCTTKEQIFW